ncbi:hypothetical protein COV11_01735 [Candidatus Woesearchaeota archaeon CG10_big_fil_rev_8_21_14_0_10_30_7]|nr:MAG: hypothetical protein COV11_01735 [Candidatus Woesearchaeota archaeon CG10_big_fil_rev_8_21_14_0_10_30_7]
MGVLETIVDLLYVKIGKGHKHKFKWTGEGNVITGNVSYQMFECADPTCAATKCIYNNKRRRSSLLNKYGRMSKED